MNFNGLRDRKFRAAFNKMTRAAQLMRIRCNARGVALIAFSLDDGRSVPFASPDFATVMEAFNWEPKGFDSTPLERFTQALDALTVDVAQKSTEELDKLHARLASLLITVVSEQESRR